MSEGSEKLLGVSVGGEGERGARRRYREPRRRFQLKCRHRRIAAVGVGVGVGVARVMCTTWPAHANRTPPRLSAFPSSSRRVLFYRPAPSSHLPIPYPCPQSLFSLFFFFYFITTLEYCPRWSWGGAEVPGLFSSAMFMGTWTRSWERF